MSAHDRLAAALAKDCEAQSVGGVGLVRRHDDHPTRCLRDHAGFAARLLEADPVLAQAMEDGLAIHRLREALGDWWVTLSFTYGRGVKVLAEPPLAMAAPVRYPSGHGHTIAEAVREALP